MHKGMLAAALAVQTLIIAGLAQARSLQSVQGRGELILCAHPNALPYSSKRDTPPGFQIELGRAIAQDLGVTLRVEWIVAPIQIVRADCDMVLDTIAEKSAAAENGLTVTNPYYLGGIVLAVPEAAKIGSLADLGPSTKVGVQAGSIAAMTLGQRHVAISMFGFETDMLEAVTSGEIAAAAVTQVAVAYWNFTHHDSQLAALPLQGAEPAFAWNVAAGLRRPDPALRAAIDAALDRLSAAGTIQAIYAHYGITLIPPRP